MSRLMARDGLRAKRSKRYRVTTDSQTTAVVHENMLARDFAVGAVARAWAGDITYLWTREGWLYLAVVLDIGTRRVIGWSLQKTLQTALVTSALDMALGTRLITPRSNLPLGSGVAVRGRASPGDDRALPVAREHESQGKLLGQRRG